MSTLSAQVAEARWYHTLELPGGIVTPGRWDTRQLLHKLPFPADLTGARTLDIGTWDGFWAFEMERRGAAEVIAIDVDDVRRWDWPLPPPPGGVESLLARKSADAGFTIAHRALGSAVERRDLSVYDLDPAAVGSFDFAFLGSLLLHLRDPVGALQAARSVVRGTLLVCDQISLTQTLLRPFSPAADLAVRREPHWWTPNKKALERFVASAGFEILATGGPIRLKPGPGAPRSQDVLHRVGIPHAWVLARPASPT